MYPKSEPRIIRGHGGTAVPIQRIKIALAKYRSWPVRKIRCATGFHNPPIDAVFEEYGVVFIGGRCTECTDDLWYPVCMVIDTFHKANRFLVKNGNNHSLQMGLLDEAVSDHMELIGCDRPASTMITTIKTLMQFAILGVIIGKLSPTPS